ncbi:hypothetical protein A2576_00055 [Candidatus Amesbacteria bacterium RIFOXYD1_FULL_47_9]|uniref:FAD/NAD(P)-binding domain-containing protein n=1 Tax=Candidatus Amesbacteria bacterium RIFOXYD1_FULL_47_9 TaxID=1797267 RepID=A0A1F5A1L5_9BACT|nr:MAG: Thioredoxin reductase [Candidatus Amesbacteria bacterium GW2011_GWA1_44_24]KKU66834.1 MAG: Thioredoxin reductase [Candidatus Amesbacteria bacterium GW2011_GWB1_47_19]OGD05264.1 MAG: hypothetical protein A2379_03630 [Candidatus Amesbacteria bacterium RIFOXYB1_FULL_47_13]OGD12450.1 MAG: hypothetical protein A2576_00055 [Candidatus Amesbacteria bacterium RIFOXYD1_FULL_47_9]HBC73196.1 thioredoxin-disulfide reductase [Candidatus Amesbacteria bacterium]
MDNLFDVIVVGSGPAGLTAAIYTSRADLKTKVVAGSKWGGQLMLTTMVENYPGFPDGVMGPELMERMRKQAERFGTVFADKDVTTVETGEKFSVNMGGEKVEGRSLLIATGALTRWIGVPGEEKLIGRGVSTCAPCDAAFFKGRKVAVVGGGDAAMEEALVLTKFAEEITIIHRRDEFKASKIMQDRVLNHLKISVMWNTEVVEVLGESKVEGVRLKSQIPNPKSQTNKNFQNPKKISETASEMVWEMQVDGVFVAIGHAPASELFKGKAETDEKGFILRGKNETYRTMTNIPGVFVAGDVHDGVYKQAVTAAGYGCEAALEIEKWLEEKAVTG